MNRSSLRDRQIDYDTRWSMFLEGQGGHPGFRPVYDGGHVPKDGKLYWLAPTIEEIIQGATSMHAFRYFDTKTNRYCDVIEPAGVAPLGSSKQKMPVVPPRLDGTILSEGVGYEPLDCE